MVAQFLKKKKKNKTENEPEMTGVRFLQLKHILAKKVHASQPENLHRHVLGVAEKGGEQKNHHCGVVQAGLPPPFVLLFPQSLSLYSHVDHKGMFSP